MSLFLLQGTVADRYAQLMCAKQSLKQPAGAEVLSFRSCENLMPFSPAPGNTVRSGYPIWRFAPRGSKRSPVRNDAGRNALSGVKVSSPDIHILPEWPSQYEDAKATPLTCVKGTPGVQVHGMYRRLLQELGRSLGDRSRISIVPHEQGVMSKFVTMSPREVRWLRSSETPGSLASKPISGKEVG